MNDAGQNPQPAPARIPPLLWVSLALILLGDLGAWYFQTDGGRIDVVGIKLPTENGQWITADLYRPQGATEKHPVPMVVLCPGFERSKESLDSYSIELARRDVAVLTIDPYNQGASSSTHQKRSASVEGYGVIPAVEYVYDTPNLNYVDRTRIGAAGYSAGGNAVIQAASVFGGRPVQARRARASESKRPTAAGAEVPPVRPPSKLAAVFVGGYVLSLTPEVLASVNSSVGMDYAEHDEGAYRNVNGTADMRLAPEALRLVNSGLDRDKQVSEVQIGRAYGDPAKRTLRIVYNTRANIHPFLPYDPRSVAHLIDFFSTTFGLTPSIPFSNQTWFFKELATLVALVGSLLFLLPFTSLLLRVPAFSGLANPVPPPLPKPSSGGKWVFWAVFALSAALACWLFVPMIRATAALFPAASASQQTWWFPQRMNNAVLLWAVANGAIGIGIFFLNYILFGKKSGTSPDMWGIRTTAGELARTLGLALAVFGAYYALVFASYGIFHTDFRFLFISAAASFPVRMLLVALEYLPLFFVFYLANSIRVNSASRFEGQSEWASMLIMGLGNSVGLMAILAIQYGNLGFSTTVFWTNEWIYMDLLFGVIPMMFILPYFNRFFFRMTGRVYLGPMVTCLVFIMMMLTSNVCYIPLR